MAVDNHLYGKKTSSAAHLGKNGSHLVCGDGNILLSPSDYCAYEIGSHDAYNQCTIGVVEECLPNGGVYKYVNVANCINAAQVLIVANKDGWWHKGSYIPNFISCCGGGANGCMLSNLNSAIAVHAGVYMMIPKLKFTLPAGKTATSARIRFKGYSDYFIDQYRVSSYAISTWAYPMKSYRLNNSISGRTVTARNQIDYVDSSGTKHSYNVKYSSRSTDLLMAWASCDPEELTSKMMFYTNFCRGKQQDTWASWDMVAEGAAFDLGYTHNLAYNFGNLINYSYNPFFCGWIGANPYPDGGSTLNYSNAYPLCDANNGTETYANQKVAGDTYGEVFGNLGGTVWKKVGGNWLKESLIPTSAKNNSKWNASPYIELTSWQLSALNRNGYIWITYCNPRPWFNTTDVIYHYGGSRQIYVEECKLQVKLQ